MATNTTTTTTTTTVTPPRNGGFLKINLFEELTVDN